MGVHPNAGRVVWAGRKMCVFVVAHCGVVKKLLKECLLDISSFFRGRWAIDLSAMVRPVGTPC